MSHILTQVTTSHRCVEALPLPLVRWEGDWQWHNSWHVLYVGLGAGDQLVLPNKDLDGLRGARAEARGSAAWRFPVLQRKLVSESCLTTRD